MANGRKDFKVALAIAAAIILVTLLFLITTSSAFAHYYHPRSPITVTSTSYQNETGALDTFFPVIRIAVENGSNTQNYEAYIATNLSQQERGYMNVSSLGDCHDVSPCIGMLFYFQNQSNLCFWMENTQIPLKQVWLNATGVATYIYNATPLSTTAICHNGSMVLETAPNQSISLGERIVIQGTP